MQGMMGSYLEKNIEVFMEVQDRMAEQSKGLYGGTNQFAPDVWTQMMTAQTPAVQTMMNSYVEQSKTMLSQMQDKMQDQTRALMAAFPFAPGHANEKSKS
jgi:polyhydroxyalkanoate synthesis regulator protein